MKTDSFFEPPFEPRREARHLAIEVICRLFIWVAEADTLHERGVRATVVLYCVRPDLISERSLEEIGAKSGRTKQAVHQLATDLRHAAGLPA